MNWMRLSILTQAMPIMSPRFSDTLRWTQMLKDDNPRIEYVAKQPSLNTANECVSIFLNRDWYFLLENHMRGRLHASKPACFLSEVLEPCCSVQLLYQFLDISDVYQCKHCLITFTVNGHYEQLLVVQHLDCKTSTVTVSSATPAMLVVTIIALPIAINLHFSTCSFLLIEINIKFWCCRWGKRTCTGVCSTKRLMRRCDQRMHACSILNNHGCQTGNTQHPKS